jgi:hypothetical protein
MGLTTTVPPTLPLYAYPSAHTVHPRRHKNTQDEAWSQHVAPADGEAKRSTPITSLRYRGSYSRRIRRKTAALEATFFVFLFHLFPIPPFYHKCNLSPPLGYYKSGGRDTHLNKITRQQDNKTTHAPPLKRPRIRSLSQKLVTPTTSTPVQGNTSSSRIHWA